MATYNLKFRPSTVEGKEGRLFYQIIHRRWARQITLPCRILPSEWSEDGLLIAGGPREEYLGRVSKDIERYEDVIRQAVDELDKGLRAYSADDVVARYNCLLEQMSLTDFAASIIRHLSSMGSERTAQIYRDAMKRFMEYRQGAMPLISDITDEEMQVFQAYLRRKGCTPNTTSFYLRILRAIYNRAVERGLVEQANPFRHVFTGNEKTRKRAVGIDVIKKIRDMEMPEKKEGLRFARDMFLFSFYTRGMSFVDMAYLRKRDIQHGILTYRRRKTGQPLTMKVEPVLQELIDRYATDSDYVLPILRKGERQEYINKAHHVNKCLRRISEILGLPQPLTMYVARHSWATAARASNVPMAVISEGMGHDSETTTQIYLASIESNVVDNANSKIIRMINYGRI